MPINPINFMRIDWALVAALARSAMQQPAANTARADTPSAPLVHPAPVIAKRKVEGVPHMPGFESTHMPRKYLDRVDIR
jgi:hypothetical protein